MKIQIFRKISSLDLSEILCDSRHSKGSESNLWMFLWVKNWYVCSLINQFYLQHSWNKCTSVFLKIYLLILKVPWINQWTLSMLLADRYCYRRTKKVFLIASELKFIPCFIFFISLLLVEVLTSFQFNVFLKRFDMLSQCLVPSITKNINSYSLALGQQPLLARQIQKFSLKYFNVS